MTLVAILDIPYISFFIRHLNFLRRRLRRVGVAFINMCKCFRKYDRVSQYRFYTANNMGNPLKA